MKTQTTSVYLDDFTPFVNSGCAIEGVASLTHTDKWGLSKQVWGARNGNLLVAASGSDEPKLVFRPRLEGQYAIYVGYFGNDQSNEIYVRLASDPHWTNLISERAEPAFAEAFFRTANLDADSAIEIANFGARCALDYIKLIPVSTAKPAAPRGKVIGICDFTCDIHRSKPEGFEAGSCVRRHKDAGFDVLLWKAFAVRCEYHTKVGERRGERMGDLLAKYDTLKQAVEEAKKVGISLYGWMRISNEMRGEKHPGFHATTPFHEAHPSMRIRNKDGSLTPRLSFAFPEVRQHKIAIACEIASYGTDGIFIDVLRHPPMAAYDLPLVEEFKRKTGQDPHAMENDGSEEWLRFRAGIFTQFLREMRAALEAQAGKRYPILIRTVDQPWRNLVIGCDVETWIREKLVDGIIFAPHCATADSYPQKIDVTPYLQMAKGSTAIFTQVWRYGSLIEAEALAHDAYEQGANGVAFYESDAVVARGLMRERLWRFKQATPEEHGGNR